METCDRRANNALRMLAEEKNCTIITTFDALMNPMPGPEKFIGAVKRIAVGDTVEFSGLSKHLVELGYEKNYQAQTRGEFSVRGGIIDIFPLTEENPFRIELWGDEGGFHPLLRPGEPAVDRES